jgi:CRISPR-associated protein Cmr6
MNSKSKPGKSKNPADIWRDFIQAELKSNSNLGKSFEKAGYGGYDDKTKTLTLFFADDALKKSAQGQSQKLKDKLKQQSLTCDRIQFETGEISMSKATTASPPAKSSKISNPLQALNIVEFGELSQPLLEEAVKAEKTCTSIYEKLNRRNEELAGKEGVMTVSFNWRVRVGGTRGFRELLLPVFHPIFGIPYIPSSSLKGATRSWARQNPDAAKHIQELLGMLEGKEAKAAKVEFLDAFPTKPCLSVDVATPQWHWKDNKVDYKPEPHPLLSMEQPQILIGLRPSGRGTATDVATVKKWLEEALNTGGIGSRVSSGYGGSIGKKALLAHHKSYSFELWTQGMYGSTPPTKENGYQGKIEFRPTAVRGILRYWFRAVALALYEPTIGQTIEDELFGKLSQQGKFSLSVITNPSSRIDPPYCYDGRIYLEATESKYLNLIEKLLILASHLGGVGRGSRRPLHLLDINGRKQMRGCHWDVSGANLPLEYDAKKWEDFFCDLKKAFEKVRSPLGSHTSDPGKPKQRQQDVLDKNAQIWLLNSANQVEPNKVKNWSAEGDDTHVRGSALNLFYSRDDFKGKNITGKGNAFVGGALETPSYVWIKSLFPVSGSPYQVVTIFGANDTARQKFVAELKNQGAIQVYPPKSSPKSSAPVKKKK